MKKITLLSILLLLPVLCFSETYRKPDGTNKYEANVNTDGDIITENSIYNDSNYLINYTSAAFTIYASAYSTDTDSATLRVFISSALVTISSVTAGGNTFNTELSYIFDLNNAVNNTIGELISSMTAQTYLTTTKVEGVYLAGTSTTTTVDRRDAEGLTEGLAFDGTGKNYGNMLSTNNIVTIYLNATTTLSKYLDENNGKYGIKQIESTATAKTDIMYLYEGITPLATTTLINIPITDMQETYPSLPVTDNYAAEFRVIYSTWSSANDRIRLHSTKQ